MNETRPIRAIRAFNRFYTNIIGVLDRHIFGSPFSLTEARILLEISHDDSCNARTIRDTLNIDEGYLSRTIDKLVKQGLVAKRRSDRDGRVFVLSLTAKGRKAFSGLRKQSEANIAAMTGHLSRNELEEVLTHMRRIQELLGGPEVKT